MPCPPWQASLDYPHHLSPSHPCWVRGLLIEMHRGVFQEEAIVSKERKTCSSCGSSTLRKTTKDARPPRMQQERQPREGTFGRVGLQQQVGRVRRGGPGTRSKCRFGVLCTDQGEELEVLRHPVQALFSQGDVILTTKQILRWHSL